MPRKVMLLRVGSELGRDGVYSPILEDGSFEFIPLIESEPSIEKRTYRNIEGRFGGHFSDYMTSGNPDHPVHYDPFFGEFFTYGDSTKHQKQLLRLKKGDLLVFYATLAKFSGGNLDESTINQYIIGYFSVVNPLDPNSTSGTLNFYDWSGHWVEDMEGKIANSKTLRGGLEYLYKEKNWETVSRFPNLPPEFRELAELPPEVQQNAHFKRFITFSRLFQQNKWGVAFTITAGDRTKSKLLKYPICITRKISTTHPFELQSQFAQAWHLYNPDGIPINMTMKVPHLIEDPSGVAHITKLLGCPDGTI